MAPHVRHGRGSLSQQGVAEGEYLMTNSVGGYASATLSGTCARSYHGLLVAALAPPLGRTLLLTALDEVVSYRGVVYRLGAGAWEGGKGGTGKGSVQGMEKGKEKGRAWRRMSLGSEVVRGGLVKARASVEKGHGGVYLESWRLEGSVPVWVFALGDALVEKRMWMAQGENEVFVRWKVLRGGGVLSFGVDAIVNCRDHHGRMKREGMDVRVAAEGERGAVVEFGGGVKLGIRASTGSVEVQGGWVKGRDMVMERERGLPATDWCVRAASFWVDVVPGGVFTIAGGVRGEDGQEEDEGATDEVVWNEGLETVKRREAMLLRAFEKARIGEGKRRTARRFKESGRGANGREVVLVELENRGAIESLVLAADQFVVQRRNGQSIMAGYPWFEDWSRDTFIALPGLLLSTGRFEDARDVLLTWSKFLSRGMLPNRFPENTAELTDEHFNTADGTLWYFESLRAYHAVVRDINLVKALYSSLCDAIEHHVNGTRFGIQQDPDDGLLRAGVDGVAVTWMDAVCDGQVFTPRIGKPVELSALWFNALSIMADFASDLGEIEDETRFAAMSSKTEKGFQRFWNENRECCYDVIDCGPRGDGEPDASLRPNQLVACSLQWSALSTEQHALIVSACSKTLFTSHGLRSLEPSAPGYCGVYDGDVLKRDAAYHNGTGWVWLTGLFARSHLRAYGDHRAARTFLEPLLETLGSAGQGTLSELCDGDAPHLSRGCIAQGMYRICFDR